MSKAPTKVIENFIAFCQKDFERYLRQIHALLSGLDFIAQEDEGSRVPVDQRILSEIESGVNAPDLWRYRTEVLVCALAWKNQGGDEPVPYTSSPVCKQIERYVLRRCEIVAPSPEIHNWLHEQGRAP